MFTSRPSVLVSSTVLLILFSTTASPTNRRNNQEVLGHHYFDPAGQPTFELGSTGLLVVKKMGDIPAPSTATVGQNGQAYGAFNWLDLQDAGVSTGLTEVYRVETAGGKQEPSCNRFEEGQIQVQYAACTGFTNNGFWDWGSIYAIKDMKTPRPFF